MNISDESAVRECTGCSACGITCPFNAISMSLDQDGFYRPSINDDACTLCGHCLNVCYKFNILQLNNPFEGCGVLAVTNNFVDDMNSVTTVGIATRLAEYFYERDYRVCGVRYDYGTNTARHDIALSLDDILEFRGSKYLPSNTETAFRELVENYEKSIVFGLPCQIHGLRKIIEREKAADQFILVDFFCAGILSQRVWDKHLEYLKRRFSISNIKKINFKDKTQGWHKSSLKLTDENGNKYRQNRFNDLFYSFLLRRIPYQEACYGCEFRSNIVSSDIRLGDFWGPKFKTWDDGVELVVLMNDQGRHAWSEIKDYFSYQACNVQDIYESQGSGAMKPFGDPPENYRQVLDALSSPKKIEEIFRDLHISSIPICE